MDEKIAEAIVDKIFKAVFAKANKYDMKELLEKFAVDIKLPKQVKDSYTNEETWADSINNNHFITMDNMNKREDWMLPKKEIKNLKDIIAIWNEINCTTTERIYNSTDVLKSDTIYGCEKVYRSTDCNSCKNIIYCDSCGSCEYLLASQRSGTCSFCIRTDDSKDCSNSYNVMYSNKVTNSYFIQDCFNLYECMFCAHIANRRFCIANMQFSEDDYYVIKESIVNWILS